VAVTSPSPDARPEVSSGLRGRLSIRPAVRDAPVPLAVAQERFWFLNQLDPTSPADNVAVALRIVGPLDVGAYARAWEAILDRHEVLRSRFPATDGRPEQRVGPVAAPVVQVRDFTALEPDAAEHAALREATAEADRPFDLSQGPVYRLILYRLPGETSIALSAFHHIACDLWSLGVLSHEWVAQYSAQCEGRSAELRPLAFQYADYAVSHREWLDGPALVEQFDYWRRQLAGIEVHELPADRPRGKAPGRGATGVVDLPPGLMDAVRTMAGDQAATPFMVLIAAFSYLIARYTGHSDVTLGTPIANRTSLALRGLVGTFVNTLVFRTDVSEATTFRDLLARVRETALNAFTHQDASFHRLVTDLKPERPNSRANFFQTLFNVQNAPVRVPTLPGLQIVPVTMAREASQFDLAVWVDTDVLRQVGYSYDTALFDTATIERLIAQYVRLLGAVVENPDLDLRTFDLLTSADRRLLAAWNDTGVERPAQTVVELIARQAELTPERMAVECEADALTYRELMARTSALAAHLQTNGVAPGALVGVCLSRSTDLLVALLAVLKAGGAYLPLDSGFPPERLAYTVDDSGAALVITEPALVDCLPPDTRTVFTTDCVRSLLMPLQHQRGARDLAYVIYTSGSTGKPKGVEVTHGALLNFVLSMCERPGITADDRLLAITTVSFDIAALELLLPLVAGAAVVIASRDDGLDPRRLARLVDERRITMLQATPTTWRMLIDSGWAGHAGLTILSGGETLTRDLAERLLQCGRAVWNLYGPTETTIWSTIDRVTSETSAVSVGRPIANTQIYVTDESRRLVPVGVPGELLIGGSGVARGYRGRTDLTTERFIPDPFRDGGRIYCTGDRARWLADGRLELLGRADGQVKIRGFRVELGEVEACLSGVPGVKASVVVARPTPKHELQLIGFVVPDGTFPVNAAIARDLLARHLPSYMIPARIVLLESLPTTLNGKVDRRALPDVEMDSPEADCVEMPSSSTECRMHEIWRDELGMQTIGIAEDFFDLGGHSLLAVRLAARVEREFGVSLPVATILTARTVRQLSAEIDRR